MRRRSLSMVVLVAGSLFSRSARAQAIAGRVVEGEARAPAAQAVVILVGDSATIAGAAQTDSAGQFALDPGRPGSYRLLFFRAGGGSVATPEFELDSTDLERQFLIPGDGAAHPALYLAGDVDLTAHDRPVRGLIPGYPDVEAHRGIRGRVRILFVIDETGRPDKSSLQILGATSEAFANSVRSALMRSRFMPAMLHGGVVPQLAQLTIHFRCATDPMPPDGNVVVTTLYAECTLRR